MHDDGCVSFSYIDNLVKAEAFLVTAQLNPITCGGTTRAGIKDT